MEIDLKDSKKDFIIENKIGNWKQPLNDLLKSEYIKHLNVFISEKYKQDYNVYPDKDSIFEAFKLVKFQDLKVVIISDKPYIDGSSGGVGIGLRKNHGSTIPFVLGSMEKCIYKTIYNNKGEFSFDYSLKNYAEQGVLMLNSSLTSQAGKDHSKIWKNFIRETIFSINKYLNNVVFLFLLKDEKNEYFKKIINKDKHFIIENNHYIIYEDSEIFLKIDELINENNSFIDRIIW